MASNWKKRNFLSPKPVLFLVLTACRVWSKCSRGAGGWKLICSMLVVELQFVLQCASQYWHWASTITDCLALLMSLSLFYFHSISLFLIFSSFSSCQPNLKWELGTVWVVCVDIRLRFCYVLDLLFTGIRCVFHVFDVSGPSKYAVFYNNLPWAYQ